MSFYDHTILAFKIEYTTIIPDENTDMCNIAQSAIYRVCMSVLYLVRALLLDILYLSPIFKTQ